MRSFSRSLICMFLLAVLFLQTACSTLMFWKKKDASDGANGTSESTEHNGDESAKAPIIAKNATIEELELKLAKTWARVDELEEGQFRLKEKLRVLEKGLTLGLMPEELIQQNEKEHSLSTKTDAGKTPSPGEGTSLQAAENVSDGAHNGDEKVASDKKTAEEEADLTAKESAASMSKEEQEAFQKMLASAQDQYRAGKYGRAIVEFSDIGKNFGNKVEGGLHQYWIAKSWIGLKEYNTARQQLQDFLKDYASSPWVPRAKLDLAKVEWRLGLQETAIQRFREIIQSYPYEDAAEMAKTELSHLDKAL